MTQYVPPINLSGPGSAGSLIKTSAKVPAAVATKAVSNNNKKNPSKKAGKAATAQKAVPMMAKRPTDPGGTLTNTGGPLDLYGYNWNLPPHKWSLPLEASSDPMTVNSEKYTLGAQGRYRRGRIYWYSRVDSSYVNTSKYNTGTGPFANDPRWGFQFLWNPTSFATSVSVNTDITPSFADKFVGVVGAFPSGEYLTVSFTLNRVNDFACIRDIPRHPPKPTTTTTVYEQLASQYVGYYNSASDVFNNSSVDVTKKIVELQKYGTVADLEHLYKAINGPGWKNQATGKETADIGFLKPTLLRIDIGPISYIGYANNISVNHTMFSKDMVPTQTDVTLQFNLMATAGLSSQ